MQDGELLEKWKTFCLLWWTKSSPFIRTCDNFGDGNILPLMLLHLSNFLGCFISKTRLVSKTRHTKVSRSQSSVCHKALEQEKQKIVSKPLSFKSWIRMFADPRRVRVAVNRSLKSYAETRISVCSLIPSFSVIRKLRRNVGLLLFWKKS